MFIEPRDAHASAVRAATPGGAGVDTSWAALRDTAAAVTDRARRLRRDAPVVVVVDGTAESIATVLGLVEAGVDVLLLEERTSHLADPQSPVHRLASPAVIGPPSMPDASTPHGPVRLSYEAVRQPGRLPAEEVDGSATGAPAPGRPGEILQLTSGSTGQPRIARQTLDNVLAGARAYCELFRITGADVVLVAVPVAHSYGLAGTLAALLSQALLVTLPRFSVRSLVAGLDDGATVLLGTPLLYKLLVPVLAARRRPTRVRTALSAGGPLAADTAARVGDLLGSPIRQIYGITEAGLVACVPQATTDWPAGSVGPAAPGVTLRIDGEVGTAGTTAAVDAAPARTGRLLVRTPALFRGYWGTPEQGLTADGFYDTGDVVRLDADGHLFVLGRKDSFVNVGGRKVNPRRVEQVLAGHPHVREAFVYGAERLDGEQEMHAAVVLEPATTVDEVLAHCRAASLMPYEVPHHVHTIDRLPRSGMGKVDRQRLLALVEQSRSARQHTSTRETHLPGGDPMTTTASSEPRSIDGVGETALWMAAARARESRRPDRLFEDPYAEKLAGPRGPDLLRYYHTSRGADTGNPYLAIRHRWFDEFLLESATPGCQVVGLGAGLDTRSYRLDWPADTVLYEMDQAAVLAYKAEHLSAGDDAARCERRVVPADLSEDWLAALLRAGFDPERPSVWFAEGVFFYLPEERAARILQAVQRVSAPGSRIAIDVIGTGIFRFPYTQDYLQRLSDAGASWRWGTDDPAAWMRACGWTTDAVLEPGNKGASFGRWSEDASPPDVPNLPRIYLISARPGTD